MQVIINADDFGFDSDTVRATIESFEGGVLTSASIMANMPATEEAIRFARVHPEFSFGVHLTYARTTNESPIEDISIIETLVGRDGGFMSPNQVRIAALLRKIDISDIERETSAQIARLRDCGVPLSHVDSHCHLHKFPVFAEALRRVLPKFGIRRIRSQQNLYTHTPFLRPTLWLTYGSNAKLKRNFATTDFMFMPDPSGDIGWPEGLLRYLMGDGVLEVGIHPGRHDNWREQETANVIHFASLCKSTSCTMITWKDVQ